MKKFLSLVLALVMTMSLVTVSAGAKDFTDADDITYDEAVEVMTAIGVVDGDTAGNFNPANGLTRGAAAKIICNLILGPTTAAALNADTNPYPDVDKDSVFAGYIAYCQKEGIISGYADGTFKPAAPLTGYAFMKMLLGALGYDPAVEGYTGANWSINVAKRALNIGLDDGLVEDFNGSDYVTREEAMLYALNTLCSAMVEYDSRTEVSIGGADVVISGSAAKPVANNARGAEGIYNDDVMQFAEKYFGKLDLDYIDVTDAYGRPAVEWFWKGDSIGAYTDVEDVQYTADVELGKIYKDLGLSEKTNADLFVNGVCTNVVPVSKGNVDALGDDFNREIGNGTLIDVYYFADDDYIRICAESTYVGTIASVKAATASVDAYVMVTELNSGDPLSGATKFEVENAEELFAEEDYVLYTYADGEIQSVQKVEATEATANTIYANQKVTLNGETIKYSEEVCFEGDTTSDSALLAKSNYDYVLDAYGYVIYMTETKFLSSEFAFVEQLGTSGGTFGVDQAKLVYTDGTAGVVNTDEDYTNFNSTNYQGNVVTFKENSKGETMLKLVASALERVSVAPYYYTVDVKTGRADVKFDNDKYSSADSWDTYYADSNTILVVKNAANKYKAYTGVKNFPTITGAVDSYAVYAKAGSTLAKIIWVDANGTTAVTSGSKDLTYFSAVGVSKHTTDTDVADYYTYNVVRDGVIGTVNVHESAWPIAEGAYTDLTFNSDNQLTSAAPVTDYDFYQIKKLTGEYTFGFDTTSGSTDTWAYATLDVEDTQVFFIASNGTITEGTVNELTTSEYAGHYVLNTDGVTVDYIFVKVPKDGVTGDSLVGSSSYNVTAIGAADRGTDLALNVKLDNAVAAGSKVVADLDVYVMNGGTFVYLATYEVEVNGAAAANTWGTEVLVSGLANGQYKVVCGDEFAFVTMA